MLVGFGGFVCDFSSIVQSPVSKRSEVQVEQKDVIVLTPKNVQVFNLIVFIQYLNSSVYAHHERKKNRCRFSILNDLVQCAWLTDRLIIVQALRTLFNIAHRLHNVLGASWVLVSILRQVCSSNLSHDNEKYQTNTGS